MLVPDRYDTNLSFIQDVRHNALPSSEDIENFVVGNTFLGSNKTAINPNYRQNYVYYFSNDGKYWEWETTWPVIRSGSWSHTQVHLHVLYRGNTIISAAQQFCLFNDVNRTSYGEGRCDVLANVNQVLRPEAIEDRSTGDVLGLSHITRAPFSLPNHITSLEAIKHRMEGGEHDVEK